MKKWLLAAGALAAVAVLALADRSPAAPWAALRQPALLAEADAIRLGVQEAKRLGLQGEPTAVAARRMTLDEAVRLDGGRIGPGGPAVGLDPDMPVWVVAIRGSVDLRGQPGVYGNSRYDNMYLRLDARTGKVVGGAGARNPGVPLPIPVP